MTNLVTDACKWSLDKSWSSFLTLHGRSANDAWQWGRRRKRQTKNLKDFLNCIENSGKEALFENFCWCMQTKNTQHLQCFLFFLFQKLDPSTLLENHTKNLILQHCSQNVNFFKDEKNREILFTVYFYFDDFFTNMSIFFKFSRTCQDTLQLHI